MADTSAISIYDEIEIEDMTFDPALQIYHYPCPCGDRFEIGIADLRDGEDIAVCPSCSLMIRVIFDVVCQVLPLSEIQNLLGSGFTSLGVFWERDGRETKILLSPTYIPA
jgi:diphthamide biosynthesis protein 3